MFTIRLGKWVGGSLSWQDNNGTMNSGPCPVTMGTPPKGSFLIFTKYHLVCEVCSWLNPALSYVVWTIWPWIPCLLHSMPASQHSHDLSSAHRVYEKEKYRSVPMDSDTKIVLIVNVDIHQVASLNKNHRPWKAVIYSRHALCAEQPREISLIQLQNIRIPRKKEKKLIFCMGTRVDRRRC